ncbi:ECF RNA polymerase sigma factor SigF [Bordetella tumbae]|uniref:sigma-70 family RNA polymerase sigma factor n=1 Tax=Bordetella tumbae TaxID=1649139 RepID=UPI0039F078BC
MQPHSQEADWAVAMLKERSGDCSAYERFLQDFAAHLRRIVRWRFNNLRLNLDETEDVVQEILIAIHSRRNQWDANRPLMPWLNAIARYKIIDAARRLRKEAHLKTDLDDAQWSSLPALEQTALAASRTDIDRLISELPPGQQSVARVIGIDGVSPSEAAIQLGMNENAVRVAFHRALKKLMAMATGQKNVTRK